MVRKNNHMMILSQIVDHYPTLKLQDTLLKAGKLFDQYSGTVLGVSRSTLDRRNLYEGYQNDVVEIVKCEVR